MEDQTVGQRLPPDLSVCTTVKGGATPKIAITMTIENADQARAFASIVETVIVPIFELCGATISI